MTLLSLVLSLTFIFIPLFLSKVLHLNLEKDTIIATVRSVVQLIAVGYILTFVFESEGYLYIILMVALIITTATLNARKKGKYIFGITWKLLITFIAIEALVMGVFLGFQIVPPSAQYIIPISGMLIGNAMVMSILFLNRFRSEIELNEDQIELILSLGGTPKQAIHEQLITSIKASMIPTIEAQKTIGLVQLPGMMSGQIIGGADPMQAVQFQIVIVFALLTCSTVSATMLGFLAYPTLFNKQMQKIKRTN